MKPDDFYIGYQERAPKAVASYIKRAIFLLVVTSLLVAGLLVIGQQAFYPSTFEFLNYRTFEGTLSEVPYPTLLVDRPGQTDGQPAHSRYYLVNVGKAGVQEPVSGLHGRRVRLQGSLIYRDDQTMIEVVPGTIEPLGGADDLRPMGAPQSLGQHTFQGEIVDSKCFLGVMNPGSTKPHRACATLCIRGGIPPVLLVRDATDAATYLLLASAEGHPVNQDVLGMVAEPVEITGEVLQYDNLRVLRADPATYHRLSP
ncbi:MAG: hypothetical protein AAGJ10_18580 [Bacteroidota bacterium]